MVDFTKPLISEKRFYTIPDELFTANGGVKGLVTVSSTFPYKVGMVVSLSSATQTPRRLKIKRVISETEMYLGDEKTPIVDYADLSAFLVSDASKVSFTEEKRPVIDILEIQRQVYQEEPTIAIRTYEVDYLGRGYTEDNPFPIVEAKNSQDYDKILITRDDCSKDITKVVYSKNGAVIRTFDLTYDCDEDLVQVDKTNGQA